MAARKDPTSNQQIRNIIVILFSGVVLGLAFVLFFLYSYGPSGQYIAKKILIDPQLFPTLWYSDSNSKTGSTSKFVFKEVDINYLNQKTGKLENRRIKENQYAQFYNLIANDKSHSPSEKEVQAYSQHPLKIVILTKTENDASWQALTKEFQEVQLVEDGDNYRIELHEDSSGTNWAFFYHPHIYEKARKILFEEVQR